MGGTVSQRDRDTETIDRIDAMYESLIYRKWTAGSAHSIIVGLCQSGYFNEG